MLVDLIVNAGSDPTVFLLCCPVDCDAACVLKESLVCVCSSGPLFSFDVHDDIRLVNDATVEKDEVGTVGTKLAIRYRTILFIARFFSYSILYLCAISICVVLMLG